MKLHCLGTAGYHPSENRHTACFFLPDKSIMLDAGSGTFRIARLLEADSIDLFLSHAHLDHIVGLTNFLGIAGVTRLREVRVYGQAEKLDSVKKHLFSQLIFPIAPPIRWIELESFSETIQLTDTHVRWFDLEHPGGCVGYRIDFSDKSMAYVTDTVASLTAGYVREIEGVDLLVHECNFSDAEAAFAKQTGHSWTSAVMEVAARARVGRLLLTHFSPYDTTSDPVLLKQYMAEHANKVDFEVSLAFDQLVVDF